MALLHVNLTLQKKNPPSFFQRWKKLDGFFCTTLHFFCIKLLSTPKEAQQVSFYKKKNLHTFIVRKNPSKFFRSWEKFHGDSLVSFFLFFFIFIFSCCFYSFPFELYFAKNKATKLLSASTKVQHVCFLQPFISFMSSFSWCWGYLNTKRSSMGYFLKNI